MKIGVFVFATEYSTDPAILARRAEALGFASFWVPEHTVMPVHYRSRYPSSAGGEERDAHYARLLAQTFAGRPDSYDRILDPFVALARASAVTDRIELGTSICLVPEHNPLLLAKRVATLDACCGGRFVFGIGAGWLREEAELMGADFPTTLDADRGMRSGLCSNCGHMRSPAMRGAITGFRRCAPFPSRPANPIHRCCWAAWMPGSSSVSLTGAMAGFRLGSRSRRLRRAGRRSIPWPSGRDATRRR